MKYNVKKTLIMILVSIIYIISTGYSPIEETQKIFPFSVLFESPKVNPKLLKLSSEKRVTENPNLSQHPVLIETEDGYGLFWAEYTEFHGYNVGLFFAKLDEEGNKISSDKFITDDFSTIGQPSPFYLYIYENFCVTKSDIGYGFTWKGLNGQLYFVTLNSDGNKIINEVMLSEGAIGLHVDSIVYRENKYYISWFEYRDSSYKQTQIFLTCVDNEGNRCMPDAAIDVNYDRAFGPILVGAGQYLGLFYRGEQQEDTFRHDLCFTKLDYEGNKIFNDKVIDEFSMFTDKIEATFTGEKFALLINDTDEQGDRRLNFFRIDEAGQQAGTKINLTDQESIFPTEPSMAWSGEEFAIAWGDCRDGLYITETYLARLSKNGTKIGKDHRISDNPEEWEWHHAWYPSIAVAEEGFVVVWQDNRHAGGYYRDGNREIYSRKIELLPMKFIPHDSTLLENPILEPGVPITVIKSGRSD